MFETRRRTARRTAGILLIFGTGCATGPTLMPSRGAGDSEVTVLVENASFDDLRIYLVRGGMREPLGVVGAAAKTPIRVPYSRIGNGSLVLVAEPRASYGPLRAVDGAYVLPGDVLLWTIDNHRATYSLRRR